MATVMVFQWRGRPWAIVEIGPNQSGFVVGGVQWFVVELTPDLTGIAGSPARVFATLPAGVTESVVPTSVVEHDGKLYFFYRANGAYGAFRAVVVEA